MGTALIGAFLGSLAGCSAPHRCAQTSWPPAPTYPPDHAYTLDELITTSVYRNNSLDVARWEAEAARGLVDQVKGLWLPQLNFGAGFYLYDNDFSYRARALNLITLNVPVTGTYNFSETASFAQIVATGGKRTSGLKQAKMFAEIRRLDVLRQQDAVAFEVANYYHLVCLTSDIDPVLEDAVRRLRVLRQVVGNLNQRGSLRASSLDRHLLDYLIDQIDQFRLIAQAGRQQAYEALKHYAGIARDESLMLREASLPPALQGSELIDAYEQVVQGFESRPETRQLDLFTEIRAEQVKFAKAAWHPNVVILGAYTSIQGNNNTIIGTLDGLIASVLVVVPIYDATRLGRLREALGLEHASVAFKKEFDDLITLEIKVTAVDVQKALATVLKAERARQAAAEHYGATRQAYSRELVPASAVAIAIGLDAIAKLQHLQSLYAYHDAKARLRRVTADREAQYGY
jgi:outer membrane protein TolC